MTRLSVNINKAATLRNARGGNLPDIIQVAKDCEKYGAQGITVHPRPDERHITYQDVKELKQIVKTEFNIEGNPDKNWMDLVLEMKPEQATLVPDLPNVLTSDNGWDTLEEAPFLTDVVQELKRAGCRTSLFLNPDIPMVEGAAKVGADRIEFYTGPFAHQFRNGHIDAVRPYAEAAQVALELGLSINAGHDLNLDNLKFFLDNVPEVKEVSIGHALICDAIYHGLEKTIKMYLNQLS